MSQLRGLAVSVEDRGGARRAIVDVCYEVLDGLIEDREVGAAYGSLVLLREGL